MEFKLLGHTIELSEGRRNYMKVLKHFNEMEVRATTEFRRQHDDAFSGILLSSSYAEAIARRYEYGLDSFVKGYVRETRSYLAQYGLYTLSDQEVWETAILDEERDVSNLQHTFNEYIVDLSLDLPDEATDRDYVPRIKAKFESDYFYRALRIDIASLFDYAVRVLHSNKLEEIEFVMRSDSKDAAAIYANITEMAEPVDEREVELQLLMDSVERGFSGDDTAAAFDSFKDKRQSNLDTAKDLAVRMLQLDWSEAEYYEFIIDTFPEARYEISSIADYMYVDLTPQKLQTLEKSFDLKTIRSEEDALAMMEELQSTMSAFGIGAHKKKDELEAVLADYDTKARTYEGFTYDTRELKARAEKEDVELAYLCGTVHQLSKEECLGLIEKIKNSGCLEPIITRHTKVLDNRLDAIECEQLDRMCENVSAASEAECNALREQILQLDAKDSNKKPYLDRLLERIRSIWDAEDWVRFTELYISTPVGDVVQIAAARKTIAETGRTASKDMFLAALDNLTEANVQAAAKYKSSQGGIISSVLNMGKEGIYQTLSLQGKVEHPAIEAAIVEINASKGKGLFGFGKKKPAVTAPSAQSAADAKFCTSCGARVDSGARFCPSCGAKQD